MRTLSDLSYRGLAFFRDRETTPFLLISLLVGVAVGVGGWLLILTMGVVGDGFAWANEHMAAGGEWFVLLTVPVGIVLAWWIAQRFAPEVAGDGVPEASAALAVQGGYLSTKSIPLKMAVTALTIGGGGSAGREGPIVQVGGAIGSSIARRFHLGEDQVKSLLAAGAAAGIGASFNAPIAGMLFGLEVILGSFAVRHMSAVVLASVAAAVTLRSLVPESDILVGSAYSSDEPQQLVLYAGLAVASVIAAFLFLKLLDLTERYAHRIPGRPWVRPALLGLVVAAVGLIDPRVLGTGQEFVQNLLRQQSFEEGIGLPAIGAGVLIALAFGKIISTSVTVASGGSGGAFMPSLFIGAALGAGYAKLIAPVWSWGSAEILPGAFAVVGMATVFAAVARAPLTAILMVFEVTGAKDYGLILPLMLSTVFATFVADRVHPESVYTMPLRRRGISPVSSGEVDLLDTVEVGDVMQPPKAVIAPGQPVAGAAEVFEAHKAHGLPVLDGDRLVGVLTVSDIERGLAEEAAAVREIMTARPVTIGPLSPVSHALQRMAVLGVGRLPVVAEDDATRLVGMFRREDAIRAYHLALSEATGTHLDRERLRQRTDPGAGFFEFAIPSGSVAAGVAVKDMYWVGCTLVSIQRGTNVIVPTGDTLLQPGDDVIAFGNHDSRVALIDSLNAGVDEPTAEIILDHLDLPDEADSPEPTG